MLFGDHLEDKFPRKIGADACFDTPRGGALGDTGANDPGCEDEILTQVITAAVDGLAQPRSRPFTYPFRSA